MQSKAYRIVNNTAMATRWAAIELLITTQFQERATQSFGVLQALHSFSVRLSGLRKELGFFISALSFVHCVGTLVVVEEA